MQASQRSTARAPTSRADASALARKASGPSTAPFGRPLVPDV